MAYAGSHDATLVSLSIVIAIFASYTALDLAARIVVANGRTRWAWLVTAALALGGGIWSMHFVAMLAFSIPGIPVGYDVPLTIVSLALPVAVTAIGFSLVDRWGSRRAVLAGSGLVMGLGIVGMHYTGMAAMRLPAEMHHDGAWVATAIAIAIGAAMVSLRLAFRRSGQLGRIGAAVAMGVAIAGMHYSAMHGAIFVPLDSVAEPGAAAGIGRMHLALWVTGTTVTILALALVAAALDRRMAIIAAREADALRESEERFRLMVQSVTDYAIFMLDTSGHVANWNSGARRIKGYEAHEIVGRHFSCFYTEEDRTTGAPARALRIAERDGRFEAEGIRVRKDGSQFLASVVIDPIRNDAGEILGFAKVTRDITERRRAQDALDQAREALAQAQKMEALGQLTGGVAHDFNNLLMAVLSSLELLRKRVPPDPLTTRLIDNAIAGAQRGATLTRRMLAFARRQELRPCAVDIPALVQGMSELLQRSIGPGVQIETRFPLGLPPSLVDAHQLELALLNLCVNARDAMPEGGTITISGAFSSNAGAVDGSGMVCLSVADTGIGMDEKTLARAVEPFYTTKGVGKGTGLGLSMVQGLAAQSDGRFVLRSSPGEGTTAEIWLPVALPALDGMPRSNTPDAPASDLLQRPLRVLLVDDDPLVRENALAMLEDLGHGVVSAASGMEALAVLDATPGIEVVVTDHAMPGMTGLELIRRVFEDRPGLPVVLATGYSDLETSLEPEIVQLRKPFAQRELSAAIRAAASLSDRSRTIVAFRPKSSSSAG